MKKFTKGCLITALILFIIGCAFCSVFGMLGGFRQLDEKNLLRNHSIHSIGLGGINFGFNGYGFSIWNDDDDWGDDWDEHSHHVNVTMKGAMTQTEYRAEDVREIDIELGPSNLLIKESEDDYIWIENNSSDKTVKYQMEHGTFKIKSSKNYSFWDNDVKGQIYLYLPAGMNLSEINLEVGAGKLDSIALAANEIDMELGAGVVTIQSLEGGEVEINLGAGEANIDNITANKLTIEGGAGEIVVDDSDVKNLELKVGMGNIEVSGSVTGNADIDCGMGNVTMKLQGAETDYNYNVECSMGTVRIGNSKYSGVVERKTVDNGSGNRFNIECGMGNIDMEFTE